MVSIYNMLFHLAYSVFNVKQMTTCAQSYKTAQSFNMYYIMLVAKRIHMGVIDHMIK